jgi:hypothetical protein
MSTEATQQKRDVKPLGIQILQRIIREVIRTELQPIREELQALRTRTVEVSHIQTQDKEDTVLPLPKDIRLPGRGQGPQPIVIDAAVSQRRRGVKA